MLILIIYFVAQIWYNIGIVNRMRFIDHSSLFENFKNSLKKMQYKI